jgi:hypothetical protein
MIPAFSLETAPFPRCVGVAGALARFSRAFRQDVTRLAIRGDQCDHATGH